MDVLLCEDSLNGVFSAVYEAWAGHYNRHELCVQIEKNVEYQFFHCYHQIQTDEGKASKVARTICRRFGEECYQWLGMAIWSDDPEKADVVYQSILFGIEGRWGENLHHCIQNPAVRKMYHIGKRVYNEAHHFFGFTRFQELKGNLLFARIEPGNYIIEMLADHFADRFPSEHWMIYDVHHHCAVIHKKKCQWYLMKHLVLQNEAVEKNYTETEREYEQLWKIFFHTIAIKERENLSLQKANMPLRFRGNMIEYEDKNPDMYHNEDK